MKKNRQTKKTIHTICVIAGIVLVIAFIVKTIVNYYQYSPLSNSAPFYVWVLLNAVYLLVPAIVLFIVGIIIKRKYL